MLNYDDERSMNYRSINTSNSINNNNTIIPTNLSSSSSMKPTLESLFVYVRLYPEEKSDISGPFLREQGPKHSNMWSNLKEKVD
jgi:hypothetical protein